MLNLHTLQTLQQAFEGAIAIQDATKVLKVCCARTRTTAHAHTRLSPHTR
jgi:hypothetical protein